MSADFKGGLDWSVLKRCYPSDDYVAMPFTLAEDYYLVGFMAYLSDNKVADLETGWGLFKHDQANYPAWAAALGIAGAAPVELPSFEAKDILLLATLDCYVRFDGPKRVQHRIPANTPMHFHRRCNMIFVMGAVAGTLEMWIEG